MLGVGVGVGVGVEVGVGVTSGVGIGVGVGVTAGAGFVIATPLFHTSFLPLLTQVYFFPFAVAVDPTFLQTSPPLTAATAFNGTRESAAATRTARSFFTKKG